LAKNVAKANAPARPGEMVLDCILDEPRKWWIGYHQAAAVSSCWPGGMMDLQLPAHAVSRAWLKMEEGLRWSGLPMAAGARCAEIGSAPGGASQSLLDRGLLVTGIDPAEMHPAVLENPHFAHIRHRVKDVRRREFRKIRWLTVDMNVAPVYTLDAVEAIVTHPEVNIRGMLLTLKLFEWEMAHDLPQHLERIRGWGFQRVVARQLQYNRQEVCVAAIQQPFRRKPVVLRRR
jgi:23S rRNA (cytidine2498-2'-O)-methyltransferase